MPSVCHSEMVSSGTLSSAATSSAVNRLVPDLLGMHTSHPKAAELPPSGPTFPA